MTNCDYAKHEGKKSEKDMSLCIGTFRNIDKTNWLKMCNLHSKNLLTFTNIEEETSQETNIVQEEKLNKDLLRENRLKYYEKIALDNF